MNTIKKAYKYRFYPNNEQKEQLEKTFGCTRFVYNHFLKIRTHEWFENQKRVGYNETAGLLVSLKKEKDFEWLKEVPSVCLQQALQNLDNAFKNFFQKRAKYPTFKKKKNSQSARYTTSGFTYKNGVIKLAKHSKPLDIKWSRKFNGNPSSVTVSKDSSGRYHISILVEEKIELKDVIKNEIGLDLGLSHAVITSEGEKINNQRFFKNDEKKLAKAQKRLSRKQKGSNNRKKARLKVAKIHARISDKRMDYAHKLTTKIVNENQVIAVESLQIKNLIRNRKLSKAISDVGWHQIIRMLEYKSAWYGRSFVQIDKFYPSSKRCSGCGYLSAKMPLSIRSWECPECRVNHDRDINAAKNILKAGKAILAGAEILRVHEKATVGYTEC